MATLVTRHELAGICASVEATVEGTGEPETTSIELLVPEGAETLVIAVTDLGPTGFLRGPVQADVILVGPDGERRNDLFRNGAAGQRHLVLEEPAAGRWTLTIAGGGDARAEVNAAVLHRDAPGKLRKLGRFLRCKGCRIALRALLIALLIELAPLVAAGLGVSEALVQLIAAGSALIPQLARMLGIDRESLRELGEVFGTILDDPIDTQLQRVCRFAKLCPA